MLLALDTVWSACSVALASPGGDIVAARHLEQNRGQAETLVPLADEVLAEGKTAPEEITGIILTRGPGTFAGVRVGIAFARSMALVTGAGVLGLSSFEAVAGHLLISGGWPASMPLTVGFPAGHDGLSLQMFQAPNPDTAIPASVKGPEIVRHGDVSAWLGSDESVLAGVRTDIFPSRPNQQSIQVWPRAENLVALAKQYPKSAWEKTAAPLYLRPADATPRKSPFAAARP